MRHSSGGSGSLDLTQFERRVHLSPQESTALERLFDGSGLLNGHWPDAVRQTLHPLWEPIEAILTAAAVNPDWYHASIRIVFQEMYRRRTTFWAWSAAEWQETLCTDRTAFHAQWGPETYTRHNLILLAYHLGQFDEFGTLGRISYYTLAAHVFGAEAIDQARQQLVEAARHWGNGKRAQLRLHIPLCAALLLQRTPLLEKLTADVLYTLPAKCGDMSGFGALSQVLVCLNILAEPMGSASPSVPHVVQPKPQELTEWEAWCQRWRETTTMSPASRATLASRLRQIGHWLERDHPDKCSPAKWTREFAAEFLATVDRLHVGDWATDPIARKTIKNRLGNPYTPRGKAMLISTMRAFLRDCQEWGWIEPRFDPRRYLATPRAIRALIAPDPRVITDDIWAKLLWAGLNLTSADVPSRISNLPRANGTPWFHYPLEMLQALSIVWLFAGLRSNELCRLRLGCIRWQEDEHEGKKQRICLLEVPVNKTGTAFTKPVDRYVGEAIEAWERVRPVQPKQIDDKTSETVHFLFSFRGARVAKPYINKVLIPTLCRKAGVPEHDARGKITSHRARSTIAAQLFNAPEPMSLFELQEWLGHASPASTQHYARITPTKLIRSYSRAGYFERNRRMIEVLIDQQAVMSGRASQGEPWRYYDLGHGYCTYDFFEQCPHRMACAKCAFYQPKESSQAQLLEAKSNLLRLKQEIPLSEEEIAAVDDGVEALTQLCDKLADVPTPAGLTPRQLVVAAERLLPVVAKANVEEKRA